MLSSINGINISCPEAFGMCLSRMRPIPRPSSSAANTTSALPARWRPSTAFFIAAQIALVDFDNSSQTLAAVPDHRATQLMQTRPCRLITAPARAHAATRPRSPPFFWLVSNHMARNHRSVAFACPETPCPRSSRLDSRSRRTEHGPNPAPSSCFLHNEDKGMHPASEIRIGTPRQASRP